MSSPGKEKAIRIIVPPRDGTSQLELSLEGMFSSGDSDRTVVLAHPHPLFGGTMDDHVIRSMARLFSAAGYSTLRFNFRGSGKSKGFHDYGRGEIDDCSAAIEFCRHKKTREILLCGYSFGAWIIAAHAARIKSDESLLLIAPPLSVLDFSPFTHMSNIRQIIVGDCDQFCPLHLIQEQARIWKKTAELDILHNIDHFFSSPDALRKLTETVSRKIL